MTTCHALLTGMSSDGGELWCQVCVSACQGQQPCSTPPLPEHATVQVSSTRLCMCARTHTTITHTCTTTLTHSCSRTMEVESKYYADGEDAFAMKRDLQDTARLIEKESNSDTTAQELGEVLAAVQGNDSESIS